jgi:hypothetical protein
MPVEVLPQLIADAAAFVVGKAVGRSFKLDRQRASRIGIWIVWGIIGVAGVVVTLVYS